MCAQPSANTACHRGTPCRESASRAHQPARQHATDTNCHRLSNQTHQSESAVAASATASEQCHRRYIRARAVHVRIAKQPVKRLERCTYTLSARPLPRQVHQHQTPPGNQRLDRRKQHACARRVDRLTDISAIILLCACGGLLIGVDTVRITRSHAHIAFIQL